MGHLVDLLDDTLKDPEWIDRWSGVDVLWRFQIGHAY